MLRLEQWILAKAGGLAIEEVMAVAERVAQLCIRAQREDAAVDVDRRIVLHGSAVGGGDLVIGVAVGLQHLDDLGQQRGALAVGQCAQCGATLFAGEGETGRKVEPGGIHAHQLIAQHRIEQRRAGTAAGLPLAAEVVGKQFSHGDLSA
ncbi:hypothetical protein D3C72_1647360 [compost metagenome]